MIYAGICVDDALSSYPRLGSYDGARQNLRARSHHRVLSYPRRRMNYAHRAEAVRYQKIMQPQSHPPMRVADRDAEPRLFGSLAGEPSFKGVLSAINGDVRER